jgi:anti-sigma regulatory factor (Ser/Thr protein kinase)
MVIHGGGGVAEVEITENKVIITLADDGPGIADINLAMKEGFSTASDKVREMGFGAGMGLPNIKKQSDEFSLISEVGKGTTLIITIASEPVHLGSVKYSMKIQEDKMSL